EGMGAQHTVYGFSYDAHNRCVLLLDMETPDMERLRARIEVLCKTLSRDGRIYRAACSAPFQGLTQASGAYLQALSAGRAAPGEPMIRFVQGDTVHDGFFYPHHELSALLDAIRKQQREQAVFLYDVLRKLAWMHRDNELLTISLLTDLINLSLSAWAELNVAAGEKEPDDTQPAQEQRFHDIDDMFAYSDTLHTQVMRLLVAHTLTSPQMDMMAVASYISATEEMETMTAGAIAERFGMTASVLSRRFKEQMGCNISDYISTRKTSFACTLLRTTTMTVTEIAQRLGYMQYSSFVRQFKQQKGVTPTAYRESIREP
ncbi:MAG: AraC family transcriptional regulator, partial [Clostridia bacterium]